MLALMQAEILGLARSIILTRVGGAGLQRFNDAYALTLRAEDERYGGQAAVDMLRELVDQPLTVLEAYIVMHRLRQEMAVLIGTALINGGLADVAEEIERALNDVLDGRTDSFVDGLFGGEAIREGR